MTQAELLRYLVEGESGLPLRDVLGILLVSGPDLDEAYVTGWADRLGLRTVWEQIRRQAG